MLKNKIFKYQEGGNVNVAPKPLYKPNAKLDNNRVVIPDIYNTRMGELLPMQLRNQWETSGMNLEDANTYRQGQKEMQSIMNRPSTFLERLERAPSETWEDMKSLVPNRTNVAPKGYKDLRGYQKSGTIGSSLGTRTWNTTDNSTVTKQMNKPYVGARTSNNTTNIHYTTPASIRATTDADKANTAYQQRNKEYWESKPSGQLATWADKKLQNWDYNMGSVPGESLLATPLRMLSSVGHSANRYSKAIENKEDRGSNILKGFGNQAMASLDGLMLADGLGAAGSKLSTATLSDMKNSLPKGKFVMNKDRMMSGPIPTFSWKPYESSADDIISSQNMDTKLQSMYDRANKQRIDDLINDRPYDPDFNEASFLNNLANTMQIHRMEVAPGRSLFSINPEGAMFSTEGGTMRSLDDITKSLTDDYNNNIAYNKSSTNGMVTHEMAPDYRNKKLDYYMLQDEEAAKADKFTHEWFSGTNPELEYHPDVERKTLDLLPNNELNQPMVHLEEYSPMFDEGGRPTKSSLFERSYPSIQRLYKEEANNPNFLALNSEAHGSILFRGENDTSAYTSDVLGSNAAHEQTHQFQRVRGVPSLDSNLSSLSLLESLEGRAKSKNMELLNKVMFKNKDTWETSAAELHSTFHENRYDLYKKLKASGLPEKEIWAELRNPSDATLSLMLNAESEAQGTLLRDFFKPSAKDKDIFKALRILPSATGAGIGLGALMLNNK